MTSALVSAFTKIAIQKAVAMTGEVTLRGRVLPVGGLKEKLLAASRFGAKKVVVPKENRDDIKEFEAELDGKLTVIYAATMDEVLKEVLVKSPFVQSVPEEKPSKRVSSKKPASRKKK